MQYLSSATPSSSHLRRSRRYSSFTPPIYGHSSSPASASTQGLRTVIGRSLGGRRREQRPHKQRVLLRSSQRDDPRACLDRFQPRDNGSSRSRQVDRLPGAHQRSVQVGSQVSLRNNKQS